MSGHRRRSEITSGAELDAGGDDGGHALAFHGGVFLDFGDVVQGLEDFVHDLAAFVDVGELTASEEDVDQDLVLVLEEFAGALDLDLDVVIAGLGADADFLNLDLVLLLLRGPLLLRVLELAEVHDLTNWRTLVGSDFHQVETGLAGGLLCFARGHDAEHDPFGVDDPHR